MVKSIKIVPKHRVYELNKLAQKSNQKNVKKTTEEYKEELKTKNPNLEPLEEYLGANIKILHSHKYLSDAFV